MTRRTDFPQKNEHSNIFRLVFVWTRRPSLSPYHPCAILLRSFQCWYENDGICYFGWTFWHKINKLTYLKLVNQHHEIHLQNRPCIEAVGQFRNERMKNVQNLTFSQISITCPNQSSSWMAIKLNARSRSTLQQKSSAIGWAMRTSTHGPNYTGKRKRARSKHEKVRRIDGE